MAEVYAARVRGEAGFQKLVALKRMLPHLTDDERFVNMFMDEGKLAANIDSPNVVSTLDLGRADDGSLYLVMELVVGTTLSTLLRNAAKDGESCPIDVACEIIAQAAHGLHDAHEAKTPFGAPLELVHRDISPQNILVGVDGRVRITDFGVARAVLRRTKTSTGEFKGKLSYFSPEQCADKNLDRRSDLFSLGVVAWETLTTRRLFHAENPLAVLERVTRMEIPPAHTVRPEIPGSVSAVVAMALERDRDQRYSTAAEFGRALRAASREISTVGGDRGRVTALVQKYGGEQLERVQAQLKESLSNTSGPEAELLPDPNEVSSGIIMRPDEVPARAIPRPGDSGSDPIPRFKPPADASIPPAAPPRRAPLYVAVVVALLGLGGGAAIGFLAGGPDDASAVEPTTAIGGGPADAPDPLAEDELDPEAPEPEAGAAIGGEPEGPEPDEAAPEGATEDSEEATGPRGRARSAWWNPGRRRTPRDTVPADGESADGESDAERAERERADRERSQRERRERERAADQRRQEREADEPTPSGGGGNGLRSVDDFMREVNQ